VKHSNGNLRGKDERVDQSQETGGKPFDKYEKFGAYHWSGQDRFYVDYVNYLKQIFENIKNFYGTGTILDVGGGDGYIAGRLSDLGFHVSIIETNQTAIGLAKEKLKDKIDAGLVDISHFDFFQLKECPRYLLLSQVIEHFFKPVNVISKIKQLSPLVAVITTPIAKGDGSLWDLNYHVNEWDADGLIELSEPLRKLYRFSHHSIAPFNQYLVLENKEKALVHYLSRLNLHYVANKNGRTDIIAKCPPDFLANMTKTVIFLTDSDVRRTKQEYRAQNK
jgi:SAM-dependent methyltransferase